MGRGRGRGRGRGAPPGFEMTPGATNRGAGDHFRGFQEASKEIQENLAKHLDKQKSEDMMTDSDSDVDSEEADEIVNRVLDNYKGSSVDNDLLKEARDSIRNAIQSSSCLICISSVKKTDPIWSCGVCYVSLHIDCIRRWAKDTIFQQKQQLEDDPERTEKEKNICWSCPKCRTDRTPTEIPSVYKCYCGRETDPAFDPWQTAHSCGEKCNRQLSNCSHRCTLLCHPGPCPPCPQTVQQSCHCEQASPITRRCSSAPWSCGQVCAQDLGCKTHTCPSVCHPGDCKPCDRTSVQSCECRKTREPRACSSPDFKCGTPCGAMLSCGYHSCDLICHPPGPCPPCPLSQDRQCPCGKSVVRLPCTEATPTCGDTCGKILGCKSHNCSERCHRGSCPSCLQMKLKYCRCGARQKEVQCAKTFTCEIKCKRTRDCQRHQCNRKCCTGDCPPCEQMCGKTLTCKNHKCLSRCHRGACYPCQNTVEVSCTCGSTRSVVPCGRERTTRPPRCRKPCLAPSNCHHEQRAPHTCHPPPCPGCKFPCDIQLDCKHRCQAACHDNITVRLQETSKPAGPWEERGPVTVVKSVECPPCQHPVPITCLGSHETCDWPCHTARPGPCGRKCGRKLPCGNHACERECHKVRHPPDSVSAGLNCKKCESPCLVPRSPACPHPCPLPCHTPPCSPCTNIIKLKCHCGISNLLRKCGELLQAQGEEREAMTCCNDQCPKLMDCSHRCNKICHPGPCSDRSQCKKKVKISCPCKRRKEEFRCHQSTEAKVICDNTCKEAKIQEEKERKSMEAAKMQDSDSLARDRETELFERRLEGGGGKKRRRNRKTESISDEESLYVTYRKQIFGVLFIAFMSVILFYFLN